MQIFQFQFNPRPQTQSFSDSFCFLPSSKKEHSLGYLCLLCQIKNTAYLNPEIISHVAEIAQNSFYQTELPDTEQALKQTLSSINGFLTNQENKEIIQHLNLAVMAFNPQNHLFLSKIGGLKILLLSNEVFDLAENLNLTPSPIQLFQNMFKGEIKDKDKLLALTPELFESFNQLNLIAKIQASQSAQYLKKLFKQKKEQLRTLKGACLLILAEKEKARVFFNLQTISQSKQKIDQTLSKASEKISNYLPLDSLSQQHIAALQQKITKGLFYFLLLIILLLLGWFLF